MKRLIPVLLSLLLTTYSYAQMVMPDNGRYFDLTGGNAKCVYPITSTAITTTFARFGGDTNYTRFEKDGTMVMIGTAKVFDDLRFDANTAKLPPAGIDDPDFEPYKGTACYYFNAGTDEHLLLNIQLPHSWDGGTLYPHVHWTPKTTSDGNPANQVVEWCMAYSWADIASTMANPMVTCGSTPFPNDANIVADKHYLTELAPITGYVTQTGLSSMILSKIYRNADGTADNYEQDAIMFEFDIHYSMDTLGSRTELSK